MKAIILAAGKGTRLQPITLETPKAMVEVFWKPLLQHNMERLLPYVEEFIIVVKYKKEKIIKYFGDEFQWKKVTYHEQGDEKWTGAAVRWINTTWNLVIAYADAIFSQQDIDAVMKEESFSVLVKKVDNPEKYGIFKIDSEGFALEVIEKPKENIWNLANFSFLKIDDSILKYVEEIELSPRWEIELTDAINLFIRKNKLKPVILQNDFLDITSVEDLENANKLIKPELWTTRYLENIGEFELHLGIPQNGINEIVTYSLDTSDVALREWTSDWKKRFISEENLSNWHNNDNRYPFTLLDSMGTVVGLWWWRPAKAPHISEVINEELAYKLKENSEHTHTSGIRIYPKARWKWLGGKFLRSCSTYYDMIFSPVYMSVDIDEHNIASQKAYEKNWFQKVWYGKNINNSPESGKNRFVYLKIS